MTHSITVRLMAAIAAGLVATVGTGTAAVAAKSSSPTKAVCAPKAAHGTGSSEQVAKFQIYESLLQATDWGAWAAWMANGTTPGYTIKPVKYRCTKGSGLGVSCRGQTTVCKL